MYMFRRESTTFMLCFENLCMPILSCMVCCFEVWTIQFFLTIWLNGYFFVFGVSQHASLFGPFYYCT